MKKNGQKRTRKRKQAAPYRMPKTASELNIDCAVCHGPAIWFDYGRAAHDHRAGFVCDAEQAIGLREKLLVRASVTEDTESRVA